MEVTASHRSEEARVKKEESVSNKSPSIKPLEKKDSIFNLAPEKKVPPAISKGSKSSINLMPVVGKAPLEKSKSAGNITAKGDRNWMDRAASVLNDFFRKRPKRDTLVERNILPN